MVSQCCSILFIYSSVSDVNVYLFHLVEFDAPSFNPRIYFVQCVLKFSFNFCFVSINCQYASVISKVANVQESTTSKS